MSKSFDGLIYARDPLRKNLVEICIKPNDGEMQIILLDALKAASFGALLSDMGLNIYKKTLGEKQ